MKYVREAGNSKGIGGQDHNSAATTTTTMTPPPNNFAAKVLLFICCFPFSLIYLAFQDESTKEKLKEFFKVMVQIVVGITAAFVVLTILYEWFPNFITVVVAAAVALLVATQLEDLSPKFEANVSGKKLKNIVKFVAWTLTLLLVTVSAFNLVNWSFKLTLKIVLCPFWLIQAIPKPFDAVVPILIGAFITHQYLNKN